MYLHASLPNHSNTSFHEIIYNPSDDPDVWMQVPIRPFDCNDNYYLDTLKMCGSLAALR